MRKTIIIGLISVGILLTAVFGVRAVKSFLHIRHIETEVGSPISLHGWMTIPYVAKAYQVPVDYLYAALKVPRDDNEDESLHHLKNNYFNGDADAVSNAIQAAVKNYQSPDDASPEQP